MLAGVNYYSGQFFDYLRITTAARAKGCVVGWDMAHGAGNVPLALHDSGCDFAVWCTYKYMNGGPGCVGGCFVHERHAREFNLPRFSGWWGQDKPTRFQMGPDFHPIPGAEGWQLGNPSVLAMAALRASIEIFDEVGITVLREKSMALTAYLESLLEQHRSRSFLDHHTSRSGAARRTTVPTPSQQRAFRLRRAQRARRDLRLAGAGHSARSPGAALQFVPGCVQFRGEIHPYCRSLIPRTNI